MASWQAEQRRRQVELRRQERATQKRRKELERKLKEEAKLSALEDARLQVEAHENAIEVLLSTHKEQSPPIDWRAISVSLRPHHPPLLKTHEFAAKLYGDVAGMVGSIPSNGSRLEAAKSLDLDEEREVVRVYEERLRDWESTNSLAKRVLAGEAAAYTEAISEFSSLSDLSGLGSSLHFTVENPKLVSCTLSVNGREFVPSEMKSFTASGKLSVKKMPKGRFHEIYQDYVCGSVLRIARKILALLPVDWVIVTASVHREDLSGDLPNQIPVLSIAADRLTLDSWDFETLDPSDSVELLTHRGDVTASRKTGQFLAIEPLVAEDVAPSQSSSPDLSRLVGRIQSLRADLQLLLNGADPVLPNQPALFPAE